jgi:predicted nucleotidyltransferase
VSAGPDFGIAPTTLRRLYESFEAAPGLQRVWIFGSRARGDARPDSDIDLATEGPGWTFADHASLCSRIESLNLLYHVDCVWLQGLHDQTFRATIDRDRRLMWSRGG